MTLSHVCDAVELIHDKLGRFPVLYGGSHLREQIADKEDVVLKIAPCGTHAIATLPWASRKRLGRVIPCGSTRLLKSPTPAALLPARLKRAASSSTAISTRALTRI